MSEDFEYKVTTIKTSGYTKSGNVIAYWESEPKVIDMSQYIPVEWIRKWTSEWQGTEFVEMLLKDWEKENESENDCNH